MGVYVIYIYVKAGDNCGQRTWVTWACTWLESNNLDAISDLEKGFEWSPVASAKPTDDLQRPTRSGTVLCLLRSLGRGCHGRGWSLGTAGHPYPLLRRQAVPT